MAIDGCGGLLDDSSRRWIKVNCGRYSTYRHSLKSPTKKLVVESDSKALIDMVHQDNMIDHIVKTLLCKIKMMTKKIGISDSIIHSVKATMLCRLAWTIQSY